MKNGYVIMDDKIKFWTGTGFTKNSEKARQYGFISKAIYDCDRIKRDRYVIIDYGNENERDVYFNNFSNDGGV